MGRHGQSPLPSVGHGVRFAVAEGHPRGPRTGSVKCPSRTSYWSSIETIALNAFQATNK